MKRQRGRGRKPGGGGHHHHHGNNQNPNRAMESNGPDVKVRGPAAHIYERYLQLARDAASSGDRVLSENYLQHADHYFRLVRLMQPAAPPPQPSFGADQDYDEGEEGGADTEGPEDGDAVSAEGGDQPDGEFPQGQQQFDRGGDGEGRRRRGRRNRFRPGGEEGGEGEERRSEGGEQREMRRERPEGEYQREPRRERSEGDQPREPRRDRGERNDGEQRERRERQPRERASDRDDAGPEGFSNGPKPAFLRD